MHSASTPGLLGYVTVTGVHGVMESHRDESLKVIHNRSFLSVPDGAPLAWIGRLRGFKSMRQVAGPDLMPALISQSAASGLRHFLWGGAEGVVERLADTLRDRHPGIQIVGRVTPPFRPLTEQEEAALADEIRRTKPHFFWVGLSTPKQERFMAGFLERHGATLGALDHGMMMLGVGAAFDFQAGTAKEAPRWIRGTGLEWLFRLLLEPRRLWRRYLTNNPAFILLAIEQAFFASRFPLIGAKRTDPP